MSKRAIAWLFLYVSGLTLSISDPIFALLAYLLDYYQHPPLRWWGDDLLELRWSFIAALVLLGSYMLHGRDPLDWPILRHAQTRWLLAWLVVCVLLTPLAVSVDQSLHYLAVLSERIILYLLIVGTVRTKRHYQLFLLMMIAGAFTWGIDAYLAPDRHQGKLVEVGGPDSLDDNSAAVHLLTALPFIAAFFWVGARWQKALALIAAPFVLNTIILCNSRGATVGMVLAAGSAVFLVHRGFRLRLAALLLVGAGLFWTLTDDTFVENQSMLVTRELDGSSNDRLTAWRAALELIRERPFGAGGGGYEVLSPTLIPDLVAEADDRPRSVHNAYLLVASDWGIPGLICFLGFLGAILRSLHHVRKRTTDDGVMVDVLALQLALIGFLGAAFFFNRTYAEILYWLAGLAAALRNIEDGVWESETAAVRVRSQPAPPVLASHGLVVHGLPHPLSRPGEQVP